MDEKPEAVAFFSFLQRSEALRKRTDLFCKQWCQTYHPGGLFSSTLPTGLQGRGSLASSSSFVHKKRSDAVVRLVTFALRASLLLSLLGVLNATDVSDVPAIASENLENASIDHDTGDGGDYGDETVDCTLVDLTLHYDGKAVDLVPAYRPVIHFYMATLDFSMPTFYINARPDTGCEVDGVPKAPVPVKWGGETSLTLYARNPETQQKQSYLINIKRLLGSETELKSLYIVGAEMSPPFDPMQRVYSVVLNIGYDEARFVYTLRDGEQRLRITTTDEKPSDTGAKGDGDSRDDQADGNASKMGSNSSNASSNNAGSNAGNDASAATSGRRLESWLPTSRRLETAHSGDVQQKVEAASFMVDAGFERTITLTVQCADATQANIGTYRMQVARPACKPEKPFFDPAKKMCVNFCPSGFYKNQEMSRCAKCNDNCMVCRDLLTCQMCKADTVDYEYIAQADGSCRAYANHIFLKYRWWCIGLALFLAFLILVGLIGICQICCGSGGASAYKKFRTYSDSEEDDIQTSYKDRSRFAKY